MLLQPLVENAVKHGVEPQVGAGSIEVTARETAEGIEISVCDSGPGLAPQHEQARRRRGHSSYGLQHVRERLQALYGNAGSLRLQPAQPTGTCAVVRFPRMEPSP
jgi:sensor histidine kinase YesM